MRKENETTNNRKPMAYDTLLGSVICWLFGHKISETTDSGYLICDRCKKHEYYDLSFYNGMPFHKAYRYIKGTPMRIYYWYRLKFFNELPF